MKIANFGVEEWLNIWENDAIYDIAGSSIASFTLEEIIKIGNKVIDGSIKSQIENIKKIF